MQFREVNSKSFAGKIHIPLKIFQNGPSVAKIAKFEKRLRKRTRFYMVSSLYIKDLVHRYSSRSSKYKHRQTSALMRNIRNIRICMGKKPIASVTYENERISIKNSLPLIKCVSHLSDPVWSMGRIMAVLRQKTIYMDMDHTGEIRLSKSPWSDLNKARSARQEVDL